MEVAYYLRQIKIPINLYHDLKNYCHANKISMKLFYKNMLDWYIQHYKYNENSLYQASLNKGKTLSLWIEKKQIETVHNYAAKNKISDARVIYTALMLYIQHLCESMAF